jgi:hypothetical protein
MIRPVIRQRNMTSITGQPRNPVYDASIQPAQKAAMANGFVPLSRLLPDGRGIRQPKAEAWVLIKINGQLSGGYPQNDRNLWP